MDTDQRIGKLEERLEELLEISEENNSILRSMERTARWSFWGKLLIWIIVLVLPFIVLGPFLKALIPGIPTSGSGGLFGLPSSEQVKELLNAYSSGSHASSSTSGS